MELEPSNNSQAVKEKQIKRGRPSKVKKGFTDAMIY
jgi:hypothetical protein